MKKMENVIFSIKSLSARSSGSERQFIGNVLSAGLTLNSLINTGIECASLIIINVKDVVS